MKNLGPCLSCNFMNNFSRNELCAASIVKRGQQKQQKKQAIRTKTTTTTKHRAGMSKITVSPYKNFLLLLLGSKKAGFYVKLWPYLNLQKFVRLSVLIY